MHRNNLSFGFCFSYSAHPKELTELKHSLLSFCRNVAAGLNHLSYKGFVHRDLAARNILVSSDDVCKVILWSIRTCMYEISTMHCCNIGVELPGYKVINYSNVIHCIVNTLITITCFRGLRLMFTK